MIKDFEFFIIKILISIIFGLICFVIFPNLKLFDLFIIVGYFFIFIFFIHIIFNFIYQYICKRIINKKEFKEMVFDNEKEIENIYSILRKNKLLD